MVRGGTGVAAVSSVPARFSAYVRVRLGVTGGSAALGGPVNRGIGRARSQPRLIPVEGAETSRPPQIVGAARYQLADPVVEIDRIRYT